MSGLLAKWMDTSNVTMLTEVKLKEEEASTFMYYYLSLLVAWKTDKKSLLKPRKVLISSSI